MLFMPRYTLHSLLVVRHEQSSESINCLSMEGAHTQEQTHSAIKQPGLAVLAMRTVTKVLTMASEANGE